jgi:hypothetical protein
LLEVAGRLLMVALPAGDGTEAVQRTCLTKLVADLPEQPQGLLEVADSLRVAAQLAIDQAEVAQRLRFVGPVAKFPVPD